MLSLEKVMETLKRQEDFSVPFVARLIGMKSTTINARILHKHLPVTKKGKPNRISQELAIQLALNHRSAIYGWITKVELARQFDVSPQKISSIVDRDNLRFEKDLTKHVRVPPESERNIRESMERYACQGMVTIKGKNYYLVIDAVKDVAVQTTKPGTKKYFRLVNRLYQRLYSRIQKGRYEFHEGEESQRLYVPEEVYTDFIEEATNSPRKPRRRKTRSNPPNVKRTRDPSRTINYNSDDIPSITECTVGARFIFNGIDEGKISVVTDDPFQPRVTVHYPHTIDRRRDYTYAVGRRKPA